MRMSTRGSGVTPARSNSLFARVPLHDVAVVDDAVGVDDAEHAVRVRLWNVCSRSASVLVTSRAELISSFSTTSTPLFFDAGLGRHAEPLEQVGGALVAERARVAHRANHHDGARVAHGEVEEVGQLLERVGAARDDDAGQVRRRDRYSSLMRRASCSHCSSVSALLDVLANCSASART